MRNRAESIETSGAGNLGDCRDENGRKAVRGRDMVEVVKTPGELATAMQHVVDSRDCSGDEGMREEHT